MQTGVDVLDRTVQQTNEWLGDLAERLDIEDRRQAYQALRAVLLTVRDRIGTDNAAHLAAQLPLLVRGIFYDGFHPAGTPTRERTREAFLDKIERAVSGDLSVDPGQAAKAVLEVLAERIEPSEVIKVSHMFPEELRYLWPEIPGVTNRKGTETSHATQHG
jgi:uncharacterized protein (DUF2267 family)